MTGRAAREATQTQRREVFRRKLRQVVAMTGSIKSTCEMLGVNRTQFNRYLSGTSMPRPEMLYALCRGLDVPMEWFFEPDSGVRDGLAEHHLAQQLRRLVHGRRFVVGDATLPDGLYLVWKATFDDAAPYESFLTSIKSKGGAKMMRACVSRTPTPAQRTEGQRRESYFYDCLVIRSANGLFIAAVDGEECHFFNFFLRQRAPLWTGHSGVVLAGVGISGAFGEARRKAAVPVMMEMILPETGNVLRAARGAGLHQRRELPPRIRDMLDNCAVPDFSLK